MQKNLRIKVMAVDNIIASSGRAQLGKMDANHVILKILQKEKFINWKDGF